MKKLKWKNCPMSGHEVKTSPDSKPYRFGKAMFCYINGLLVGGYSVSSGQTWAWIDPTGKQICPTNRQSFSTQKAAKEWIIGQLSQFSQ